MVARVKKKKTSILKVDNKSSKKNTNKINPIKPIKPVSSKNDKSSKKDLKKNEKVKEKEKSLDKETKELKTVRNPYKDKLFQVSLKQISKNAKIVETHPTVKKKQEEIKDASVLSSKEQVKDNNLKEHYTNIESSTKVKEEKKFSAKKFKSLLSTELDKLEDKLPQSSSAAKEFKKDKPLNSLKSDVNEKVLSSKKDTLGDLETNIKSNKVTKSEKVVIEAKDFVKEEVLQKPKKIVNSRYAIPKKKHNSEISMEKESKKLDSVMENNGVTNEQLENSNEETFISALDSKKSAKQKAKEAPSLYRKNEKSILYSASIKVKKSSDKEFTNMIGRRNQSFDSIHNKQVDSKDKNQEKKRDINKSFENIYLDSKKNVNKKLDGLTTYIDNFFEDEGSVTLAKKVFENNVENKLDDIYGWTTLDDTLFGEDTDAIEKVFRDEKKLFISTLDKIFEKISEHISNALNDSIGIIKKGKEKTTKLYTGLSKEEKELAKDSYENFTDKYSDLEEKVNDKEKELAQSLASKYKKNIDSLDESFAAIKKKVSSSWIDKAIDSIKGVIETIKKLGQLISTLASELKSFIPKILDDPISFVKLLFGGVKEGINLFKENIKKHIITGFIKWLTGSLGPMNITLPKDILSLSGIFSLVMQVLGLGWDFIRKKAVKAFGEPAVKVLEISFEMFKIFKKDGIKGIWGYLKERFNDLKEMVIEEIKSMLITQVILAGVKWLVGLFIPGGAFIKAIIAIKDFIVTLVESALALIPIIIKAIKALASGDVKGLSKLVEQGLSSLVAIIISLFAKVLGLGGLSKKVLKIIERIRSKIDKAVDKLIAKAKKSLKKFFKKGKKTSKSKKEKPFNKKLDKNLGEEVKFKVGKDNHRLWIKKSGNKIDVMVASTPYTITKRLSIWKKKLKDLDEDKKKKAETYINKASELSSSTERKAKDEDTLKKTISKDKLVTKQEYKKFTKLKKELIVKEVKLKRNLSFLFDIFGHDAYDFQNHYKKELDKLPLIKGYIIGFVNNKITKKLMQSWQNVKTFLNEGGFVNTLTSDSHNFDKNLKRNSITILRKLLKQAEYKTKFDSIILKYKDKKNEEGFLSNRIGNIRKEISIKLNENLSGNKFDKNDLKANIKAYLIKSIMGSSTSTHTAYKPKSKLDAIEVTGNEISIEYKYEDEAHKHRKFSVSFDFSKLNKNEKEVTQTSKGENLQLKEAAGIKDRGSTDGVEKFADKTQKENLQKEFKEANTNEKKEVKNKIKKAKKDNDQIEVERLERIYNILENAKAVDYNEYTYKTNALRHKEKGLDANILKKSVEGYKKHEHLFESAHMIADEFLGSGYKEALNLLVTSQEYNRVTMRHAEMDIKKEVETRSPVTLFDLNVKATWDYLHDKDILDAANYNTILKGIEVDLKSKDDENKKMLAKDFASTLQEKLVKTDNPTRVLGVVYTGKTKTPDKNLTKREIGCDIWKSSYFKFDKSKCTYKYKVG